MWLDAYRAKGLKGTGIVFDNARRTETESFPPSSLGGSFIALFVGSDAAVEHGAFGKSTRRSLPPTPRRYAK